MKNNNGLIIGSGLAASLLAFGVTSGLISLKDASIASLLAAPAALITHIVTDSKAQKAVRESDSKLSKALRDLDTAKQSVNKIQDLENKAYYLNLSLDETKKALDLAVVEHEKAYKLNQVMREEKGVLAGQVAAFKSEIEQLQLEIEEWEEQFSDRVELAADAKFQVAKKAEIQKIFDEHDAITSQAMQLFQELQQWGQKVAHGHQTKREIIQNLARSYNENLLDFGETVKKEHSAYVAQIEILNERVGQLQHQINGDLLEPEYLECGFDQNGRIANAIAEWLWNHHKIPLKVTGFEVSSDVLTAGYTYPRSMPLEALVKQVDGDSSQIARSLGLYAIEKPHKLEIADVFTVKVRRERPARKADKGSLYRSKEEFVKYVLSQPVRLRIVGEPGSGKTPSTTVLLGHILKRGFLEANTPNGRKLPYCVVESCNPLAGISVKNGDELDFCLSWNDGKKGFKGLAEEYRFRKNPANAEYKNQVGYIWVADEVDVTMADLTKEEAKPFKDALKDGGHINLGVIVMGQSANVSTSKGLSIDDQKMLTNIYIDAVSIRTFLTQYGERFYSKRAVEKALATLEELELEIEEKNEVICDTAREFRIAMVTASRSPVFYQLPYFDSVEIDTQTYHETWDKVALIRASQQQPVATADKLEALLDIEVASTVAGAGATPTQVSCPQCASTVKRNGKTSTGVQKYLCKNADCKHGFTPILQKKNK
ncbi:MAG TPA: hypothetical protein V6D35_09645 [Candidatus Sericytochromatia bacterium]|jgi:hypothetical protein